MDSPIAHLQTHLLDAAGERRNGVRDCERTVLYPIVVSELWHWTGNKNQLRQYVTPALKAM